MKEHILDLIIVEKNEDHFKIWDDYFSKKFKIKVFNSLENCLKDKNIFNNDTIFIIQITQQKSHFHKNIQNNIIYLIDHNLSIANIKSDKNFYVKKPVSLSKIQEIIDEIKNNKERHKEEIIRIKKYILIPLGLLGYPLLLLISGFVGGVLGVFIYNLCAKFTGGYELFIKMEGDQDGRISKVGILQFGKLVALILGVMSLIGIILTFLGSLVISNLK